MRGTVRILIVAALAVGAAAPPAGATITGVIPANQDGPNDSFFTNEILYATGVNNALSGAAQLCVVPAGTTSGTCPEDGIWGRPNVISHHGTFPPTPIVAPHLPEGTWRILGDNGDDGGPADVVSDQFTVLPCPAEDACSTAIADAQMQQWKDAAAQSRTGMAVACLATTVYNGGTGSTAGSALVGGGLRGALIAEIKGDGVGIGFTPRQTQDAALALLRSISCGAFLMYDDIVADPPDPDFKHLETATPDTRALALAGNSDVSAAAQTLEDVRANGVAHRIGVERYQGAVLASDEGWASVHATRVGEQALATQSYMRRVGTRLRAAAAAPSVTEPTAATAQDVTTARAIRERIRVSGFTSEEIDELQGEGLTSEEIAEVRAQLGEPLPENVAPTTPAAALHAAADAVDGATCIDSGDLCGFDTMGRFASAAGANGRIAPTISLSPLVLREGNRGSNHARVQLELSHPSVSAYFQGHLTVTPGSAAEDEVYVPVNDWHLPEGHTRTQISVATINDRQDEPTETATIVASVNGNSASSAPATVTVLDDDGADDTPTPPRGRNGLIAMAGNGASGVQMHLSEPDATELTPFWESSFLSSKWVPAWSPNGRWLLVQHTAPTASALAATGEPVYRVRVTEDGAVSGEPGLVVEGKPYPVFPTFSRDGRRIVMGQFRDGLYKLAVAPFDPATGATGPVHVTGDDPAMEGWWAGHGASFNPDRSRIAFAGCSPGIVDCGLFVVPVSDAGAATGPPVRVHAAPANDLMFPAWSPDGRAIAYTQNQDGKIGLRTLRVSSAGARLADPRWAWQSTPYGFPGPASWAPDSSALAFGVFDDPQQATQDDGVALVLALDADGAAVGQARSISLTRTVPQPLWGNLPDDTAPTTTLTASPAADADGIHRAATTVSLKATDNRAVTELEYALDGVVTTVARDDASLRLERNGTYTVRYRARDAAGNVEAEKERVIHVDIPSPTTPAAPPADPPPVVVAPGPTSTIAATLPPNKRCVSRRRFRIRLAEPKDDPLVRAEVFLGRKRVKVVSGARLTAAIDLRGLPKGRVQVRVVATTRAGRTLTSKRTYRTCAPRKRA